MLFISPQKLFSFSRYFNFCLTLWSCSKTDWEKDEFNFKFYDVTSWLANNILTRTGNQTMKFGQYITWETFFLKNHTRNVVKRLVPDLFLKNQNWAYLWINILKFYIVCFHCIPSWGLSKYIETKLQTACFYLK